MRGSAWLLLLALLPAGASAAATTWPLGQAEARLLQAGYAQDPEHGAWEAEVELRFVNHDPRRRFNRNVTVQFVGPTGKSSDWKSFVSLAPGAAQHRRVRVPQRLACPGDLAACPSLRLRVGVEHLEQSALVEVPRTVLEGPTAPPEGQPLWAARVIDGDTLELLDGSKLRLLGIDAPERKRKDGRGGPEPGYQEATDFTRERVMGGPLRLAYDGEKRDIYGRWLVQVTLEDGTDLNAELLRRGLARIYARSEAKRLEDYKKIEAQAREQGLGLWKAGNK
jgi:endonuclease YncB( thermonuclease family)